jgi:hypothetical protein
MNRIVVILAVAIAVFPACADEPPGVAAGPSGPWSPAPDIPTLAELRCGADGTTTLSTDVVQPRPDGVHLDVINELDETVSVEGFDADPGPTGCFPAVRGRCT